jgi:hypothetical protein
MAGDPGRTGSFTAAGGNASLLPFQRNREKVLRLRATASGANSGDKPEGGQARNSALLAWQFLHSFWHEFIAS